MNPITPDTDIRDKAKRCLEELRRLWGDRRDEYTLTRDLFAVLEAVVAEEEEAAPEESEDSGGCLCERCQTERFGKRRYMPLCLKCGNKRCPKALYHAFKCTGSNEQNQPCFAE